MNIPIDQTHIPPSVEIVHFVKGDSYNELSDLPSYCVRSDEENQARILQSIDRLAYQLHLELRNKNKNICFAPLSIFSVIGMAIKAMPEEGKAHFMRALDLADVSDSAFHTALMAMIRDTAGAVDADTSFKFANAIGLSTLGQGFIDPSYKTQIQEQYAGEFFTLDEFNAVETVNKWASEKTDGMISNFLSPSNIPKDPLVAILLNAISFTAKWQKEFKETFDGSFTLSNGRQIPVKMMRTKGFFALHQGEGFSMAEIPYRSPEGHALSHIIFLPDAPDGLSALETLLTPECIQRCRANSSQEKLELQIPKINLDFREEDLFALLCKMGLPLQISLSLLGSDSELSAIIHQAKLQVDETGTKAAAVTGGIIVEATSHKLPPKTFFADHPYVYLIVDGDKVLFRGNIVDGACLQQ